MTKTDINLVSAAVDSFVPHDEVGSMVSQPSARELPGTLDRVVASATNSDVKGVGAAGPPRAARSTTRANAPTAPAVPNSPECPAAPPSAAA